jgi:hypothetical protein
MAPAVRPLPHVSPRYKATAVRPVLYNSISATFEGGANFSATATLPVVVTQSVPVTVAAPGDSGIEVRRRQSVNVLHRSIQGAPPIGLRTRGSLDITASDTRVTPAFFF